MSQIHRNTEASGLSMPDEKSLFPDTPLSRNVGFEIRPGRYVLSEGSMWNLDVARIVLNSPSGYFIRQMAQSGGIEFGHPFINEAVSAQHVGPDFVGVNAPAGLGESDRNMMRKVFDVLDSQPLSPGELEELLIIMSAPIIASSSKNKNPEDLRATLSHEEHHRIWNLDDEGSRKLSVFHKAITAMVTERFKHGEKYTKDYGDMFTNAEEFWVNLASLDEHEGRRNRSDDGKMTSAHSAALVFKELLKMLESSHGDRSKEVVGLLYEILDKQKAAARAEAEKSMELLAIKGYWQNPIN